MGEALFPEISATIFWVFWVKNFTNPTNESFLGRLKLVELRRNDASVRSKKFCCWNDRGSVDSLKAWMFKHHSLVCLTKGGIIKELHQTKAENHKNPHLFKQGICTSKAPVRLVAVAWSFKVPNSQSAAGLCFHGHGPMCGFQGVQQGAHAWAVSKTRDANFWKNNET